MAGALLQEVIDVAVDPERAAGAGSGARRRAGGPGTDVAERFRAEHVEFAPELQRIRTVADRLGTLPPDETRRELEAVRVVPASSGCRSTRRRRRRPSTRWWPS